MRSDRVGPAWRIDGDIGAYRPCRRPRRVARTWWGNKGLARREYDGVAAQERNTNLYVLLVERVDLSWRRSLQWGPYQGAEEARARLVAYVHAVYGRPVGIIWSCGQTRAWLQMPTYDSAGDGVALLVRCDQVETWPQLGLHALQNAEAAFSRAALGLAHAAEQAPVIGPAVRAAGAVIAPVDHFLDRHPAVKDGVIVIADIAGVIAGVAAAFTLVTVGGTALVVAGLALTAIAGAACLVLLVADGIHLWHVARGELVSQAHLEAQSWYQWVQALGPLLTLPDLAMGGRSVLRESAEASAKASEVGARSASLEHSAAARRREFHQTIADADQSWDVINAASAAARKSANDYRRMAALAQRENRNLAVRRNAVLATAGGAWATRQYVHEPPKLTEQFLDRAAEWLHLKAEDPHRAAEIKLGAAPGSAARPGQAGHLLTPAHGSDEKWTLHLSTVVVKRPRHS